MAESTKQTRMDHVHVTSLGRLLIFVKCILEKGDLALQSRLVAES